MDSLQSEETVFYNKVRDTREDFEMLTAMMKFALAKNGLAFSLSGLRIPKLLQDWQLDSAMQSITVAEIANRSQELTLFQEHLYDRIVSLAASDRMMRETWRINESTRRFRELELKMPEHAPNTVARLVALTNALFLRDEIETNKIIDECLKQRTEIGYEMEDRIEAAI